MDPPLIVLDDDPTGTQAVEKVPVLLEWDAELVREAAASGSPSVHVLTNSRAFPPARAAEIVRSAADAAVAALGRPRLALRGDSTLRAHLLEEYLAVRDAAFPGHGPRGTASGRGAGHVGRADGAPAPRRRSAGACARLARSRST